MTKVLFRLTIIILATAHSFCLLSQTEISGGISENTSWTIDGNPYIITGRTVLFAGYTLTIDPGVTIKFADGVDLRIQGILDAKGTASDSISFISNSLNPSKTAWKHIFVEYQGQFIFEYVNLKNSSEGLKFGHIQNSASCYIKNTTFSQNNKAMTLDGGGNSSIDIDSTNFESNNYGIVPWMEELNLRVCSFTGNINGALLVDSNIDNCLFSDNSGIGLDGHTSTITNSVFINNNVGLEQSFSGGSSASTMTNNYFTGNGIGLRITGNNPMASFTNNTFCSNTNYNVVNTSTYSGQNLSNNCWGTLDVNEIEQSIYDGNENINVGLVQYTPISTNCSETATAAICEGDTYVFGSQNLISAGEYTEVFQSVNECDSTVVLTLSVNPIFNETATAAICEGDSYVFGSQNLISAGEYTEVFQSVNECDSTVVLTLSVNPIFSETATAAICEGDTYVFGSQNLISAGEYTEVFQSVNECDSTVVLTLSVNPIFSETATAAICEGDTYTFGSQNLISAGEYTEVFQSVNECDSTVVLTLSVNPIFNETATAAICEGDTYTFGSQNLISAGEYTEVFQSVNECDSTVVLTLSVNPIFNETATATICEGDTYVFGSQNLISAGEYTEVFQSVNECDSTVVLTLSVNPIFNETATATICEGDTYVFGSQNLISAGEYTEVFQSVNECDSTVVLTLSVNPIFSETATAAICEGDTYVFGSQNLISAGEYTEVFQSVNECDSTVVLTLSVNPIFSETATAAICEGDTYTFGSQNLISAGEYTEVFQSVNECDSTVVLTLSVNPIFSETATAAICEGDTYTFGSQNLISAGEYTEVFQSVNECDSTVVLTLSVNPIFNETATATICEGDTYVFGSQNLISAGEYTEVFQSANECDSTVVLTLSVNPIFSETATAAICEGDTYVFGSQNLISAGEYTEVFQSVNECDSTVVLTLLLECVLGTNLKEVTSYVSIYPNPTSDFLNISFNRSFSGLIELIDLTGRLIKSQSIENRDEIKLEMVGRKGTFILILKEKAGRISSYRILKD